MPDILDLVLSGARQLRQQSPENPKTSLANPAAWLWQAFGAGKSAAGVRVGTMSSMGLTAFWACVKIISETQASLPLITYRRTGNSEDNKERALDRPEYYILHDEMNPQMTSMVAREVGEANVLTWGNAYFLVQFNKANKPKYLWPLKPDKTAAVRQAGNLVYETTDTPDGKMKKYAPEEVVHVPGLGFNGLSGFSPIAVHRETIGHGIATEKYGSAFFGSPQRPSGVYEIPTTLTDEAYGRLKSSLSEVDPHHPQILEEGLKYHVITIPPEDAQYIETRKFNISDMARIFRMPLAMLEEHDKAAAYASVEQFFLQFAVHTMRPWLVRWEQEINRKVFGVGAELYCEHNIDALLRGDLKSRYDAYHQAIQDGWQTWNDVRKKENMNLIPKDLGGDTHWVSSNLVPSDRALNPPEPKPQPQQPQTPSIPVSAASATRHGANGEAIEEGGGGSR
jgi:HK97 family phage portal protein